MSSDHEEQRREIERILKEIYAKFDDFDAITLYYKEVGKELSYIKVHDEGDYLRVMDVIFNRQLDYALYVRWSENISPSGSCIERRGGKRTADVYDALKQFLDNFRVERELFKEHKDPLDQLLEYNEILAGNFPRHVYYCSGVYVIIPYDPDPTSIFPGKHGIVAYCTTFENLVRIAVAGYIDAVVKDFSYIWSNASIDAGHEVEFYAEWLGDEIEACELSHILRVIHNKIEEADKLMRQYGIVRVIFPLD